MQNQSSALDIQTVLQQISIWRRNRSSSTDTMPDSLKVLIAELVPIYPIHDISSLLRIKHSTINYFYKKFNSSSNFKVEPNKNNTNKQNIDFIPMKLSSLFEPQNHSTIPSDSNINDCVEAITKCQIIKVNGTKLIIHIHDVSDVIKAFLCSN